MMASKRKNFHYHYAEKFDVKSRKQTKLFLPKKTVIFAVLVLLIFGIVTTTFSAYISENEVTEDRPHSILVDVRNTKVERDIALTGANVDLAASGYNLTGPVYYVDSDNWGSVYSYFWKTGYSSHEAVTQISGTKIWYRSDNWNGYDGFIFYKSNNFSSSNKTDDITADVGAGSWFSGKSNEKHTDPGMMNSKVNVTTLISYDGGATYTAVKNSNIYTSIALKEFNYATSTTSATDRTGDTRSNNPYTHYPAYGSNYTLTAHYPSGVEFRGFYDSNTQKPASAAASNTSTKTASKLNNGEYNWYAYYVVPYVTSASINPSNIASGSTKPSISYVGDGRYSKATLTAPSISAYSFKNWTFSAGTQTYYSSKSSTTNPTILRNSVNCTATANYKLKAPSAVSLTGIDRYAVGDAPVSLHPSITSDSVASGATVTITQNKSYTITHADGTAITSGDATVDNDGYFSATVPGRYKITLSVYNTDSNYTDSTNTPDSISSTITSSAVYVTVYPAKPEWSLTMTGFEPGEDLENGHEYGFDPLNPYVVTLGSNFSFNASIDNPPNDSNYVYTWYNADDEVLGSVTSTGSSETTKITFGSDTASEASSANVTVPAYCKVTYTGTDSTTIYATGDTITVYYYIKSLIKDFKIDNLQKIYDTPNDSKMKIEYNILSGNGYTTTLYASSDNVNFYEAVSAAGFLGTEIGSTAVYQLDPSAQMYLNGPKYFYLNMGKSGANAKSDVVHTTVGANNAEGTRAIYFINNAGLDLTSYRVMAFYIDGEGDLRYQTAQDVFKGVSGKEKTRFRVMIPSDATKISFGIARKNRYALPDLNDTELDYTKGNTESGKDNIYFVAYTYNSTADSAMITLDDYKNTVVANSKTLVSGYTDTGDEPNPFYQLSFNYTSYRSAD